MSANTKGFLSVALVLTFVILAGAAVIGAAAGAMYGVAHMVAGWLA